MAADVCLLTSVNNNPNKQKQNSQSIPRTVNASNARSCGRFFRGPYKLLFLCVTALCLLVLNTAHSADGTWTSLVSGGLWSNTANWSGGVIADDPGAANFGTLNLTANNTVVLDAPHTLTNLIFGDTTSTYFNWTLNNNGNAANVLTLAGTSPSITVNTGLVTNNVVIAGTGGLKMVGAAATTSLVLGATNTFSGDVHVSTSTTAGTFWTGLYLNSAGALGGAASTSTIYLDSNAANRAALYLNAAGINIYSNNLVMRPTVASARAEFHASMAKSTNIWNGNILCDGVAGQVSALSDIYVDTASTMLTINGNITATSGYVGNLDLRGTTEPTSVGIINGSINIGGTLAKNDANTWIINSANNAWSNTAVQAGTLKLGANNALPLNAAITVGGGAVVAFLDLNGYSQILSNNVAKSGGNADKITNSAATLSLLTYSNAANVSCGVIVGGNVSLLKLGTGTLTLSAANTYTGNTVINSGSLALSGSGSIASSSNIVVAGAATFDVSGASSVFALGSGQTLSNSAAGALIKGANQTGSGTVSLVYDGVNPSFIITNGAMTLSASTVLKVNITGPALMPGSYKLIAKATTGNVGMVAGTLPSSVTVVGNLGDGTLSLSFLNGELYLMLYPWVVSPSKYDFGIVATNSTAQVGFTISNSSDSMLNGIASVGTAAYSIVSGSPYSVAPGSTATVTVQFSPLTGSNYTDIVQFVSGSEIFNVSVTGMGMTVPVADFTGTPRVGITPLTVTFTDTSSGGTTNRLWNFGDGTTTNTAAGTVQHTFTSTGRWTVTLVASNSMGISTNTKPNYISTTPVVRILPVGDSITLGSSNPSMVLGGYRTLLAALMTNANFNVVSTGLLSANNPPGVVAMHEGHSGAVIAGVNYCMQGVFDSTDDPDIILLLLGTNDYGQGVGDGATNRLDAMISNLATNRPNAKIIVANVLQRTDNATYDSQIASTFNPFVPGIVAKHAALGQQVYFTDMRTAVGTAGLSPDNLHPSAFGYALMATNWFKAITNVMGVFGSTNMPVISHVVSPGGLTNVTVTFSKPVSDSAANPANFTLSGGVTISAATLDAATKRVVTLTTSPLTPNARYTLVVSNVVDLTDAQTPIAGGTVATFNACGARGATNNVAEASHFQLVYALNIPNAPNYSGGASYTVDNHASLGAFGRVAYYLELQATNGGPLQYMWVSMNPFTTNLAQIGVPTAASGAVFQQNVTNMNVASSVAGIVIGTNLVGGNLEFWSYNYTSTNLLSVANAGGGIFDWGDQNSSSGNFGSMQIGNPNASQSLLSFNAWGGTSVTAADLGIGNNTVYQTGVAGAIDRFTDIQPDWTFRANAASYAVKTLQVFIQPVPVPGTTNLTAVLGWPTTLAGSDLVALAGTPANYPLSVTAVSATSTNGGAVVLSGGTITYTPAALGLDRFSYTLSDGNGGAAIGYVNIITSVTGTNSIATIGVGNPTTLTASGVPNYYYILQRATNLTAAVWVNVQTNQAALNGAITGSDAFNDLGGSAPAAAYYRFQWQP